jgi:hypothetical protein
MLSYVKSNLNPVQSEVLRSDYSIDGRVREPVRRYDQQASAIYRLIQNSNGENNAVPVLIRSSVSVTSLLTDSG